MSDPHIETARAVQAQRIVSDPLVIEAFAKLEEAYLTKWKETGARDTDARERLWQAFQIVGKVQSHLRTVIDSGKLAQAELNEIERLGERKKVLGVF